MKRGGLDIMGMAKKAKRVHEATKGPDHKAGGSGNRHMRANPFLSEPIMDVASEIAKFINTARNEAINSKGVQNFEIEARLGVLHVGTARVCTSGAKTREVDKRSIIIPAFNSPGPEKLLGRQPPSFYSGVSNRHFQQRTTSGLSVDSTIALAFGVPRGGNVKEYVAEKRYTETVFSRQYSDQRLVIKGEVEYQPGSKLKNPGVWEDKGWRQRKDIIIPAASYDLRLALASEKQTETVYQLPAGMSKERIKRRTSYTRKDGTNPWQIDVTIVTTRDDLQKSDRQTVYEVEMELQPKYMERLLRETSPENFRDMIRHAAFKLWEIMQYLNPLEETVDVEDLLEEHESEKAKTLAGLTCRSIKDFLDKKAVGWPITNPSAAKQGFTGRKKEKLPGCMPVSFDRGQMEKVRLSSDTDYFLSEKTDGVRHFMIFTGDGEYVLVDRAMKMKQPKCNDRSHAVAISKKIKPGTVLDGEVVMHRGVSKSANGTHVHEARPIFLAFDVMIDGDKPLIHKNFEERKRALENASFCHNPQADEGLVFPKTVADMSNPLPLVRKRFVNRRQIGQLFNCVIEEKGFRSYRQLPLYNHLTDGIIFQPNTPYVCGTDHNLSKWKYPDTATIDVQLISKDEYADVEYLPPGGDDDFEIFPVVGHQHNSVVGMKKHIHLPKTELFRLNADRIESQIAEVGKDPESGEWYYLTMRPDKTEGNHISTVLGTVLELTEALDWKELKYTMQLRAEESNNWSREQSKMDDVLMDTQRLKHAIMDKKQAKS